jgi:hypothetical protein
MRRISTPEAQVDVVDILQRDERRGRGDGVLAATARAVVGDIDEAADTPAAIG